MNTNISKIRIGVLYATLLSIFMVSSFWIPGYAYVTYGNVHGTILDNYSNPIENVEIQTYDNQDELVDTDYTLSDGFFRLLLDKGTFTIRCVKDGYVSYEASIYLPSSSYSYNINSDPVDMGEIEMSHTLSVSYQVVSRIEEPGETILFPFTVTNIGEVLESPQFKVDSPKGWETRVLDSAGEIQQVQFGPGSMCFSIEVQIPETSFESETITLSVIGYTTQTYEFTLNPATPPVNSVELFTAYPSISVKQGETFTFTVTLSNNGFLDETLELVGGLPEGWSSHFLVGQMEVQSLYIEKGRTESLTVEVTPKDETPSGIYEINISAVQGELVRDSVNLELCVEESSNEVELQSGYRQVTAETGNVITYTLTVRNQGDIDSLYTLSVPAVPEGWDTEFKAGNIEVSNVYIASGSFTSLSLEITPPGSEAEGSYNLSVMVESEDGRSSDTLDLMVNLQEPSSEMDITSVYTDVTVQAGDSITYPIRIWNKGASDNRIKVTEESTPSSWDTKFTSEGVEASSFLIEAGALSTVNFIVEPPNSVNVGEYVLKVTVETEEGIEETVTLNAEIMGSYDMTLELSSLYKTLTIGESVEFTAEVRNPGNSPLTTLYLETEIPDDWDITVSPAQTAQLESRNSVTYNIVADTPADTVAGDYLISVKAVSDQGESDTIDLRVTAQASNTWGYIGYGIAGVFVIGLIIAYTRFKRR